MKYGFRELVLISTLNPLHREPLLKCGNGKVQTFHLETFYNTNNIRIFGITNEHKKIIRELQLIL
jgi:hypothetical protein